MALQGVAFGRRRGSCWSSAAAMFWWKTFRFGICTQATEIFGLSITAFSFAWPGVKPLPLMRVK